MEDNYLTTEMKNSTNSEYNLQTENGVVLLTSENVYKVLAMISYDSSYNKVYDKSAKYTLKRNKKIDHKNCNDNDIFNYIGSSAYWFNSLISRSEKDEEYRYCLYKAVCAVDNENSTHLNGGKGGGRIDTWKVLCDISYNELLDMLQEENKDLIKKITYAKNGRRNISFASKFCHYACRNLLTEEYWDNYPIIDGVLKEVIPYYAEKYQIEYNKDNYKSNDVITSYNEFVNIINNLSKKTKISTTGIDQLLWYYYKGQNIPKAK